MSAPDKIYLVHDQPTGCLFVNYDKHDPSNLEYVRKDTLLDWAKEKLAFCKKMILNGEPGFEFRLSVYEKLIEKLESL